MPVATPRARSPRSPLNIAVRHAHPDRHGQRAQELATTSDVHSPPMDTDSRCEAVRGPARVPSCAPVVQIYFVCSTRHACRRPLRGHPAPSSALLALSRSTPQSPCVLPWTKRSATPYYLMTHLSLSPCPPPSLRYERGRRRRPFVPLQVAIVLAVFDGPQAHDLAPGLQRRGSVRSS